MRQFRVVRIPVTDNRLSKQEVHPRLGITENVDQIVHDQSEKANDHLGTVNQDLSPTIEQKHGAGVLISVSGDAVERRVEYNLRVLIEIQGEDATSAPP